MKKKRISLLILGTLMSINTIAPVIASADEILNDKNEETEENDVEELLPYVEENKLNEKFNEEIKSKLNLTMRRIEKAKQANDIKYLNKALKEYEGIAKLLVVDGDLSEIYNHKTGDDFDLAFRKLRDLIYDLPENFLDYEYVKDENGNETLKQIKNTKSKKIYDFQRMLAGMNKECLGVGFFKDYTEFMFINNEWKKDLLNPHLKRLYLWSTTHENPDANEGEEGMEHPDIKPLPDVPVEKPPVIDDNINDNDLNNDYGSNYVPEQMSAHTEDYVKKGNDCYKVMTYYKDGKPVKTKTEKANKSDYVYCNIYDYVDMGGGLGYLGSDLYVPNAPGQNGNWDYIIGNQNPESDLTLQFTIEKDKEKPYYFDTGIRTNLNGEVSFEQLKDVLFQVAVKAKGYLAEDKDKALIVIEGKPIVVKNSKKLYNKEDLKNIFKTFEKIEVVIQKTKIGDKNSLEEEIKSKRVNKLKIDDRNIELETMPIIKNDRALFNLEQIAKELDLEYKFEKENNKVILSKDKNTFEYFIDKDFININKKEVKTNSKPEYKNGLFMGEINDLIEKLNYELEWDGDTSTITINKK